MSRVLYVDSGAFIALLYRRDQAHARTSEYFRRSRAAGDLLLTSEPVIAETVTRLRYDSGLPSVLAFRQVLDRALASRSIVVRESDAEIRSAAFAVLERYSTLRLSYADAVGAVIAGERRVDAVLGLDEDFRIMGFVVEPG